MLLTPSEQDRLLLFTAAELARSRRRRGLRLNVPEAIALIADTVCEVARDGGRHADALAAGTSVLGPDDVLDGVAAVVTQVQVEAVFDDGSRLVVVPDPIRAGVPDGRDRPARRDASDGPGSWVPADPAPGAAPTAEPTRVTVTNTAAVPISVSSHFHFFEANPRLRFDRAAGYGRRLALPAGGVRRFDPGATVEVELVPLAGERVVVGFSGLVEGPLDAPGAREQAVQRARACGFLDSGDAR